MAVLKDGRVIITPQAEKALTLAARLARFEPAVHGVEVHGRCEGRRRAVVTRVAAKAWVPDWQDLIWIDCGPQAAHEMRDLHPLLVLSPNAFNARTSLVIGLPMSTAAYTATHPFAVPVGTAVGRRAGKVSRVLCHQPKSLDRRARRAKPHR